MLLSAKTFDQFFKLAFNHFTKKLDQPFDFLRAVLTIDPPPTTLSGNLTLMLQRAFKAVNDLEDIDSETKAFTLSKALAPVVCSAIALDTVRSFGHDIPGTLVDVFKGKTSHGAHNAWKATDSSYEEHVSIAFAEFVETSMRCEFTKDNVQCVNTHKAHMGLQRHQVAMETP